MRSPNPQLDLDRWLEAEAAGDDEAAELALRAAMLALPDEEPAPGFAAAVLGSLPQPAVASWLDRSLRWFVVTAASAGFFSAAFFVLKPLLEPLLVAFGWDGRSLGSLPGLLAALVSLAMRLVAALLAGVQQAAEVGASVSRVLESPAVALAAASSVVVGGGALFLLTRLLGTREAPRYVDL